MIKLNRVMFIALLVTMLSLFYTQVISQMAGQNGLSENVSEERNGHCQHNDKIIILLIVIIVLVSISVLLNFYSVFQKCIKPGGLLCQHWLLRQHYQTLRDGELENATEDLQRELDRRKAQYKLVWRDAPLYADWRKEEFTAVSVTLDEATAHPALFLFKNGKQVTWQEIHNDLPSSTQRFDSIPCVLGQQGFSKRRYYWEVNVEKNNSWDLGVCRDNVTRKGRITISPQNGFWAIRFYGGEYWALTSPETALNLRESPLVVGIFLDYEDGDISFYNMTDGSHIFSFPKSAFSGVLRPFFRLWPNDSGHLSICESNREQNDFKMDMLTH